MQMDKIRRQSDTYENLKHNALYSPPTMSRQHRRAAKEGLYSWLSGQYEKIAVNLIILRQRCHYHALT